MLGLAAPSTEWPAESGYGELELTRARCSKQQQLGRPELVGNELEEAAGVRVRAAMRLQWPWRRGRGTYGLYAARRAGWARQTVH